MPAPQDIHSCSYMCARMHACDETLHARPDRKAPEDEAIKLVEVVNSAAQTMERAMKAIEHLKARGGIRAVA